jgi:hypothetical protein
LPRRTFPRLNAAELDVADDAGDPVAGIHPMGSKDCT